MELSAQTHCRGRKWVKRASQQVRTYGGTDRPPSHWQAAGISHTRSITLEDLWFLRECVGLCWAHMLTTYWPRALSGASTASWVWETAAGQREWGTGMISRLRLQTQWPCTCWVCIRKNRSPIAVWSTVTWRSISRGDASCPMSPMVIISAPIHIRATVAAEIAVILPPSFLPNEPVSACWLLKEITVMTETFRYLWRTHSLKSKTEKKREK